jgi:hypothetical protein
MQSFDSTFIQRWKSLVFLASVAFLSMFTSTQASVAEIELKSLVARSDLVVVVVVTKVEVVGPPFEWNGRKFPAVHVATARVLESWKGARVPEVRFVGSPTGVCDSAEAAEGEELVLF